MIDENKLPNTTVTISPVGNYESMSVFGKWYHLGQRNCFFDGGSFMDSLKHTFFMADAGNREKLITGFPDYFNENDITLTTKQIN